MKVNTIFNEDCLKTMARMDDNFIDLVVTSPPYDNLRTYKGYTFHFKEVADSLFRVMKPGGVIVWIVNDATINGSETGTSFRQALYFKEIGFKLHDTMIWNKGAFTATGSLKVRYASVFDFMFILSLGKPKTFNPIKDRRNKHPGKPKAGTIRSADGSLRRMSNEGKIRGEYSQRYNVWEQSAVMDRCRQDNHPAPFPLQLAIDHIISWSNEGDLVYDPFLGSGTTCYAAKILGRKYLGSEISSEYFIMAKNRVKKGDK